LELLLSGRGVGATLPVSRWRADHLMAVLAPTE
jgi:phospholipid N-methyltransferase